MNDKERQQQKTKEKKIQKEHIDQPEPSSTDIKRKWKIA